MAELASYIGVTPRTLQGNGAINRGLRVIVNSSGTVDVAGATVRGDFVLLADIEALLPGVGVSLAGGGKVPARASEAVNVGDLAYAAANGFFSKTSTNAAALGRWVLAASGNNILGEVELFDVA